MHRQISEQTGAQVSYCDAHSPWQRGFNENMNGLLRDYWLKSTDLRQVTPMNSYESPTRSTTGPARHSTGHGPRTCSPTRPWRRAPNSPILRKIAVGSRSTSASSSSTFADAGTRSYSWNLRLRSRQYKDHNRVAFV